MHFLDIGSTKNVTPPMSLVAAFLGLVKYRDSSLRREWLIVKSLPVLRFCLLCYRVSALAPAPSHSLESMILSTRYMQVLLRLSLGICFSVGLHFCGSMVGGTLKQRGHPGMGPAKSPQI